MKTLTALSRVGTALVFFNFSEENTSGTMPRGISEAEMRDTFSSEAGWELASLKRSHYRHGMKLGADQLVVSDDKGEPNAWMAIVHRTKL